MVGLYGVTYPHQESPCYHKLSGALEVEGPATSNENTPVAGEIPRV